MKTIVILMLFSLTAKAQVQSYTSSDGIEYHVGDTIKLGYGSGPRGEFTYLAASSLIMGPDESAAPKRYSGTGAIIKKIVTRKQRGIEKTYFTVGVGNIVNYTLDIEGAIHTCEVPCK